VRYEDAERIKRKMEEKEMLEIDEILRKADESLARASPERSKDSLPNSLSQRSLPKKKYIAQ
jgi:hypothetical protein